MENTSFTVTFYLSNGDEEESIMSFMCDCPPPYQKGQIVFLKRRIDRDPITEGTPMELTKFEIIGVNHTVSNIYSKYAIKTFGGMEVKVVKSE